MALSIFIMIYYAFGVIKDNKYNIGLLKPLGYRWNELSVFSFPSFLAYFVLNGTLFGIIFNWLTKNLNHVLMVNLSKGFKMVSVGIGTAIDIGDYYLSKIVEEFYDNSNQGIVTRIFD